MTKAGVPGSTFPLSFLPLEGSDVPGAKSQSLVTLDGLFYFFFLPQECHQIPRKGTIMWSLDIGVHFPSSIPRGIPFSVCEK